MPKRAKKAVQTEGAGTTKKRGRPAGKRSTSSFARLVTAERKRLQKLRDKVHARRTQIDRELADVERGLQAMGSFVSGSGQSGRRAAGGTSSGGGVRRAGRGQRR